MRETPTCLKISEQGREVNDGEEGAAYAGHAGLGAGGGAGAEGRRAIISRGWAKLRAEAAPDGVLCLEAEPRALLFPRCAGIAHHGGAGTTHAAARAGVPQVVMPYLLDQHFWAHRTRLTGISPTSVPRHGSDPEPLARAMRLCIEDAALRARARELSSRIATDGVRRAADLVERIVG